jgi:hypothetical protein
MSRYTATPRRKIDKQPAHQTRATRHRQRAKTPAPRYASRHRRAHGAPAAYASPFFLLRRSPVLRQAAARAQACRREERSTR